MSDETKRVEEDFEGHKLEPKIEPKVEPDFEGHKFEPKIEPKVEPKIEP
jgi:hypothetical protein